MISKEIWKEIRRRVNVLEQSRSEVARELGISRNTVKKYLKESCYFYKTRKAQPWRALDGYKEIIEEIVNSDQFEEPNKRHTARQIFKHLVTKGYSGAESTVRRYVKIIKDQIK
ncbi:helix-turn-helix domain-containing protein [Myxococcota bacterium]|nr:helix-turn-helix domain-containing protein [Myxococcota bacterium]MBU1380458.1 helix-turn-helix domain-containing protein [Myxococcota bacterium]MBU1497449.1 helix-turn-helix domain-containing protein [Myxococcota bacterium]